MCHNWLGIPLLCRLDCICFSNKLSGQSEACPHSVSKCCATRVQISPHSSRSTSAPKYSLCRFLLRPLICAQLHYSALSCACGSLFAKTFRIPSRGIIEFRMYKYHQPWTFWTAGLSVVYVHKRESRVGVISTLGLSNSTHHPGGMWAPSPTATTFVFGPFVARACKKNKTILKRKDQVSNAGLLCVFVQPSSFRVPCCAVPIKRKRIRVGVYIRVPNLAVRDEGEEMKWSPRKSHVQ